MTSWVVSDSGILVARVLKETFTFKANALWKEWGEQGLRVAAPTLLMYEMVAVMRKNVYRGLLTEAEAIAGREILLTLPVQLMMDANLLRRGHEFAVKFNRPTAYDSQYLAVAEHLGCDFWTADEKLFNAVNKDLTWVRWIGNYTLPNP